MDGTSTREKQKAEDHLERLLLEGLNSPETELQPGDWAKIRTEALLRIEAQQS